MLKYIFLAALVFSLGCISAQQNNGLVIGLQADPPVVFVNGATKIFVDITNTDTKRLENVRVDIFNTGILTPLTPLEEQKCRQQGDLTALQPAGMKFILPGEFRTFSCSFQARQINQDRVTTQLDAKASFDATFSAVQNMELLSESEYNNRLATGRVKLMPQSYTYSDRNIQLQLDFTDPLPIVVKEGRNFFVKFTIRNVGNGFISEIKPEDVQIIQKPSLDAGVLEGNVLQSVRIVTEGDQQKVIYDSCGLGETLPPLGKEFPSFSCRIVMPPSVHVLTNYNFIVNIRYHYEIRDSVTVDILR